MSNVGYPRFSNAEMERRLTAARAIMDAKGIDALVIFGHSGNRRHYQADIHYFAEVSMFHEAYLLVPRESDPVLFTTHGNHYPNACELSRVADVRRAGREIGSARVLADEITARGLAKGRLGMVGSFFYQEMDGLRRNLPDAVMSDESMAIKRLRSRKSPEEIAYQRKAALGCDMVMDALRRDIRPGIEERDIQTIAENTARTAGCEFTFLYLNSTQMANSESCVPSQQWSRRKIQAGDVINTELTVNYGMYCSQILRPFFLGEPTKQYQEILDVTRKAYHALWAGVKAGVTVQELYEISLLIRDAGLMTVDGVGHGFGIDICPPTGIPNAFKPPLHPGDMLEEGMTYVIQPNPTSLDFKAGMQLGDMGLVTADGFENMHRYPADVTML